MKIGERLSVSIDGVEVAEAFVEDIEDGQATIVIPATRLVAQVRQSLDLSATRESDGPDRVLADALPEGQNAPSEASTQSTPADVPAQNNDQHVPLAQQNLDGGVKSLRDMDFDTSALDKEE